MKQKQYSFPRESRLLTPLSFSRVFEDAVPAVSPQVTLLARQNNLDNARLGLTIPKKKVKRAVDRNRIKRCVRESFRLRAHQLPNIDIIMIAKNGIGDLDNRALNKLLEKQWNKLASRCKN